MIRSLKKAEEIPLVETGCRIFDSTRYTSLGAWGSCWAGVYLLRYPVLIDSYNFCI